MAGKTPIAVLPWSTSSGSAKTGSGDASLSSRFTHWCLWPSLNLAMFPQVLGICHEIMDEAIPDSRADRDFRAKFPDDVLQENMSGLLWFGAEVCKANTLSLLDSSVKCLNLCKICLWSLTVSCCRFEYYEQGDRELTNATLGEGPYEVSGQCQVSFA